MLPTIRLVTFLYAFAYALTGPGPVLAVLVKGVLTAPDASSFALAYGYVSATYPVCKALGSPLFGALSDVWGKGRTMAVTTLLTGVSFMGMLFATSMPQLIVWRCCTGILAGNGVLMAAYITENTSLAERPVALNNFNWMWSVAGLAGSLVLWSCDARPFPCCTLAFVLMASASLSALLCMVDVPQTSPAALRVEPDVQSLPEDCTPAAGTQCHASVHPAHHQPPGSTAGKAPSSLLVLRMLLHNSLSWQLLLSQALTPAFDITPLVDGRFGGDVALTAVVRSVSSGCAVVLPALPLVPLLQRSGLNPVLLAAAGTALTAAASAAIGLCGYGTSVALLMCACCVRETVVVVARPFQASAVLDHSPRGAAGAFSGWRECLKASSAAVSTVLLGVASAAWGCQVPHMLAAVGLAVQALIYLRHSRGRTDRKLE